MNQHCVIRHSPRTAAQRMLRRIDLSLIRCPVHDIYLPTSGCWWLKAGYFQLKTKAADRVFIANLWVEERMRGDGTGRRMMDLICKMADQHGVTLTLYPEPFDAKRAGLTKAQLSEWYARFGFEFPTRKGAKYAVRRPR